MKKTFAIILTCAFAVLIGCTDNSDSEGICYSFDKRQCDADPWVSDAAIDMPTKVKDYLSTKGIAVKAISIDMDHHVQVCEACTICPVGPRIYVRIDAADAQKLKDEEFLNIALDEECIAK